MLTLALLLATAPLPAGTVVFGLSSVDGTTTELTALAPSGERELLAVVEHARGRLPKGLLLADRLVLVTAVADDARGVLEEVRLHDGARHLLGGGVLADHALAAVPPSVDRAGAVLFVRQPAPERFEVVRAADGAVLARADAAWLQPARGRPGAFLLVERGGGARLVELSTAGLHTVEALGKGTLRSPAVMGKLLVVELAMAKGRARVLELPSRRVLREGLAGMDPLLLDDATVAFGAGTKAAAVIVDDGRAPRTLSAPQAGVAHPLAGAMVGGRAHVVAWLDRGSALPGELWRFSDDGAVRLLEPAVGVAVEVYGVVAP
ncbi:MAG: hypothetical protein HYS27_21085 [Deltaproteobacteria bacterium]|nr:hypothetical protein [Deltaproteobacteria bacterium]